MLLLHPDTSAAAITMLLACYPSNIQQVKSLKKSCKCSMPKMYSGRTVTCCYNIITHCNIQPLHPQGTMFLFQRDQQHNLNCDVVLFLASRRCFARYQFLQKFAIPNRKREPSFWQLPCFLPTYTAQGDVLFG